MGGVMASYFVSSCRLSVCLVLFQKDRNSSSAAPAMTELIMQRKLEDFVGFLMKVVWTQ